jgi:predicted TIM-barrel fold metal-dependent hydrolase
VSEVTRAGKAGITGIVMTDQPEAFGFPYLDDPHWEPLWHTLEDFGMPCNFHIGAGASFDFVAKSMWSSLSPQRKLAYGSVALFLDNFRVIANLILSGLLDKHPNLKFVSVESGIGWVPFVLEALEYQFDESVPDEREGLSLRPKEYFRRQIYASFWFEDFGPRAAIETIGEDNVMFETDFPHPTCLYPKSQEHITNVLADLDDTVRRKVLRDNAVAVYHLPD